MSQPRASILRLPSVPIWLQIIALVVGALVAAQVVTFALTLLLPPAPPQQHSLQEIAQALEGGPTADGAERPLIRVLEHAPPSLDSPGWVVAPRTTRELAGLLNAPEGDVRILFYAPPPLAGTAGPPPRGVRLSADSSGRPILMAGFVPASAGAFEIAQGAPPAGPAPGGPPPGAAMLGAAMPGGFGTSHEPGHWRRSDPAATAWREAHPGEPPWRGAAGRVTPSRPAGTPGGERPPGEIGSRPIGPGGPEGFGGAALGRRLLLRSPLDAAVFANPQTSLALSPSPTDAAATAAAPPPRLDRSPPTPTPVIAPRVVRAEPVAPPALTAAPALPAPRPIAAAPVSAHEIALAPPAPRSVFGLPRPSAYVEGDFVAALRTPAGWVTVRPRPEGFPNSWERRVLLWFAMSLALVAPPAYLLARRLVTPLHRFADAAERLGRDPMADLPPLAGPAEIGRAAEAFNTMRLRLRRYVEDRTGMISAISHDLRTPLARMRFKMERAPPAVRSSLARDVDQMEAMISSVLAFMRDELSANLRETADLRSILECVVDDAGGKAELAPGSPIPVHVDLLAIQRVFENLVDNAVKYGGCARVTLIGEGGDVVVEVADDGPGLPPEEIDEVFKPFYRGSGARNSGAPGVGLGLAVSRSVLRSHGGDLTLVCTEQGLIARARLPALDAVRRAA